MKINLRLDKYDRETRLFPAIATIPPFLVFYHFYINAAVTDLLQKWGALAIGDASLITVGVYYLMELNRLISKGIIENFYFSDELKFPTTNLLLFSDSTYSNDLKLKIHKKIWEDFRIKLLSKYEEQQNEHLARQKINEAVALIREKVKAGRLVLRHNIHYGATRNLIGGAFIGITVSIIDLFIFSGPVMSHIALIFAWVLTFVYAMLILFSKFILSIQGKYYAKRLINEYLYHKP